MQTAQAGSAQIEREQWDEFLADFGKRNENKPTRLEVVGEDVGVQELERYLPLIGINLEPKGSEPGSIEIILGAGTPEDPRHMEHMVFDAKLIVPISGTRGFEDGLAFESKDGTKTLLTFETQGQLPPH